MNRKLRHTLSALSASGAALAIALMVAVPAGMNQELPRQAMAGQHADELGTLAGAVALSAEIAWKPSNARPARARAIAGRPSSCLISLFCRGAEP
jgi:hypothetical protein